MYSLWSLSMSTVQTDTYTLKRALTGSFNYKSLHRRGSFVTGSLPANLYSPLKYLRKELLFSFNPHHRAAAAKDGKVSPVFRHIMGLANKHNMSKIGRAHV